MRLLVIDPSLRITINDIKQHPAFRIGVPDEYVLPSPLPFLCLEDPVDVSSEVDSYLTALVQVGFKDKPELVTALSSQGTNMAKVFFTMLSQPLDPSKIAWQGTRNDDSEHPFLNSLDLDGPNSDPYVSDIDSPHERRSSQGSTVTILKQEQHIRNIKLSMMSLMTMLQTFLTSHEDLWYHPDDRTLIVKDTTACVYMILNGDYSSPDTLTLIVQMYTGTNDQFESFFQELNGLLWGHIVMSEGAQLTEANAMRRGSAEYSGLPTAGKDANCDPM